jgi:hypothetical protein
MGGFDETLHSPAGPLLSAGRCSPWQAANRLHFVPCRNHKTTNIKRAGKAARSGGSGVGPGLFKSRGSRNFIFNKVVLFFGSRGCWLLISCGGASPAFWDTTLHCPGSWFCSLLVPCRASRSLPKSRPPPPLRSSTSLLSVNYHFYSKHKLDSPTQPRKPTSRPPSGKSRTPIAPVHCIFE